MIVMTKPWEPSKADKKVYQDMEVGIAIPCADYESPNQFMRSLANMVAYSWMCGLKVYEVGIVERMIVHWGRNELAKNSLERVNPHTGREFTHILWLDNDHVFNADMLVYLARHKGLDAVSGLYYCRVGSILPTVYVRTEDGEEDKYRHYPLLEVPEALIEVDAVGFGAMLMRLDVLKRMEYPYFSFDMGAGEDIYFCVKAKEAGVRIWLDGSYRLGHIGEPTIITHQDHLKYLEANKERYADKKRVSLGGIVHE